jgi:hypothetical protein
MRTFEHFNSSFGDKCPVCKTAKDTETVLVPIPGTDNGNICEARQVHKKCYDLLMEMNVPNEKA